MSIILGQRPRLTFHIVCLFFILGFIGVTVNQLCYLEGLRYTSPIFASAMRNTTPVFTFIIAVLCRMEKLRIRKLDGQAKVVGTALAICGSVVLSIYRGPAVLKSKITILHIPEVKSQQSLVNNSLQTITIIGSIHDAILATWRPIPCGILHRLRLISNHAGACTTKISCPSFPCCLVMLFQCTSATNTWSYLRARTL
ncbi:hypothetical protein O6H91_22G048200 [Diphasiastrum complanatum]|uniref:Uncharacterized protein n=1 Tax=Diphasiastrum complanatum TaxID=34168 RepID=A0ACC2AGK4_DIPCM|nr:hypothetical protein O6H91_22G048200 [Diphasiastrum complanatum]